LRFAIARRIERTITEAIVMIFFPLESIKIEIEINLYLLSLTFINLDSGINTPSFVKMNI
jgi:hypothetical protein